MAEGGNFTTYDAASDAGRLAAVMAAVADAAAPAAAFSAAHPHVAGAAAAVAAWLFIKQCLAPRRAKTAPRRKRATSIGSTKLMLQGLLPDPNYDCVINARVGFSKGLPSVPEVKAALAKKVAPFQQFHSVPVVCTTRGDYVWAPVALDLEHHVREEEVAAGGMNRRVDDILNEKLGPKEQGRPWWEFVLLRDAGAASGVMLVRVHHVIGDGVSLMEMFADVLHTEAGVPLAEAAGALFRPSRAGAPAAGVFAALRRAAALPLAAVDAARCLAALALAAYVGRDTPSAFNCTARGLPLKRNRFAVYLPSHSVALVKLLKDKASAADATGARVTVNDVEFALVAGTVRRFMEACGEDPQEATLRALTPFGVGEMACPVTRYATLLRNYFTLIANPLPVAAPTPLKRLAAAHSAWAAVKNGMMVPVAFAFHRAASAVMPWANLKDVAARLQTRHAVVFSNVPGPQIPVYFAGAEVTSSHMLFPNLSQQVGLLSVNGWMHGALTVASDLPRAKAQELLAGAFAEELHGLAAELGVPSSFVEENLKDTSGAGPAGAAPAPRPRRREPTGTQ
eukprot:TRINITY_DN3555_c0_g1_i1.p1 TRINITY_DN3555_c0_g1~~TRINITY_DN3555_c0_g1_i1.p1  ORF type:complete len:583 (+),score=205.50 TRINITY_DN3555_c0_g1_i1:49-1749(+)